MNINAHFRMRRRTIVLAVCAVILTWLVVSRSLVAFLADTAPQAALWVDPRQPEALVNLADQAVNTATTAPVSVGAADETLQRLDSSPDSTQNGSGEVSGYIRNFANAFSVFETIGRNQSMSRPRAPDNEPAVRMWATTAVMNEPLNARALRILGQLAEADSDDSSASKFMHEADRLSLHESIAAYWLLRNSAQASDYKSAIYYADVLLRTDSHSYIIVVPILAQISEDKTGAALVKTILTSNPPWRDEFISKLPNSVTDARTPLDLLLALRTNAVPPTTEDIKPYLDVLIAHKLYSLAYYTWLQFLSPSELRHAGLLFNGNFAGAFSGLPFDWEITPGAGVAIDVVPRPDKNGEHALLVDFQYGRVDYHSVTELVMLSPGTYEFKGDYKADLVGPRGMKWRIICSNGTLTSGGESPMITGREKNWKNVAFTFTVPDKDCAAQYVRLDLDARMASEQLISGSILFGDLQISRVTGSSTAGG
jgi:hypothetical protein